MNMSMIKKGIGKMQRNHCIWNEHKEQIGYHVVTMKSSNQLQFHVGLVKLFYKILNYKTVCHLSFSKTWIALEFLKKWFLLSDKLHYLHCFLFHLIFVHFRIFHYKSATEGHFRILDKFQHWKILLNLTNTSR